VFDQIQESNGTLQIINYPAKTLCEQYYKYIRLNQITTNIRANYLSATFVGMRNGLILISLFFLNNIFKPYLAMHHFITRTNLNTKESTMVYVVLLGVALLLVIIAKKYKMKKIYNALITGSGILTLYAATLYIIETKNLIIFTILALIMFIIFIIDAIRNKRKSRILIIATICAITASLLSLFMTKTTFVKKFGELYLTDNSKEGINLLLRQGSSYRTREGGRSIPPLGAECIKYDEPGFNFVKDILQQTYYGRLDDQILLIALFQEWHHPLGDPMNPLTTSRPILIVPSNNETKKIETEFMKDSMKIVKYGTMISNESAFTNALFSSYKNKIYLFTTLLIMISILLNTYQNNIKNRLP
jgi:hypothetical protein